MRVQPVLAAAALAVLLACPGSDNGSPGKADGEACNGASECRSGLCFAHTCQSSTPASATCTLPKQPTIVVGAPIDVPEPAAGTCAIPQPVSGIGFLDLGEFQVGSPVSFQVPPGTASFTILSQVVPGTAPSFIVFQGFGIPNSVVPTDLLDPTGALFYSDTVPLPRVGFYDDVTRTLAYYAIATPFSGAFTVPNTSAALDLALTNGELPPGRWSFTVNDFARECTSVAGCSLPSGQTATGRYRIQVLLEGTPQRPFHSTGTLDLEIYLATDPASAFGSPNAILTPGPIATQFARWANSFAFYFAQAGICLGNVTVHDLPLWAKARYAFNGQVDVSGAAPQPGCDDLSQLFTLGRTQNRAVHMFFADELVDASVRGGFIVLGVDGSIPGPSGAPGTVNGGAIVGVFDLLGIERSQGACQAPGDPDPARCGTDALAYIAAHEAGHWLGLYHTTEAEGITFDPLSDTATCACLQCAPFALRGRCAERSPTGTPTLMVSSYCSGQRVRCGGSRDLMFWLFDERFAAGQLSRQQGDVMRRNPAIR